MVWLGVLVVGFILYLFVRRSDKAQHEALGDQIERTNAAHKDFISLLLDKTPGGIYEGWEAGTRALMQRGLPFGTAKSITESVIRERIGADPHGFEGVLFELEPRLRATFGQPEPNAPPPRLGK
jgi:hypothetical protein